VQEQSDEVTRDTLLRGRVTLLQPKRGFRSSLDPVLLAGFLTPPFGRFLDIGCASGALSFLLLARDPVASGVGVEIQPRLAALAEQGRAENGFADRLEIVTGDVRARGLLGAAAFDLVASNPPFRPVGTGVLPPLSEKAMANHEVALALNEWVAVAARAVHPAGRLATIFPYGRWDELRDALSSRGFFVSRLRLVAARVGEAPHRLLLEARRSPVAMVTLPPLVVHGESGYSDEVRRILGEDV
jgi:tRNA1Val (adenine37-N6)-methyltransferase